MLEAVRKPSAGLRPNNVLLNDPRYRQVWYWYLQLLRHEEEQDRVWDWQSRMWADVVRMMAGAALELWRTDEGGEGAKDGLTCLTLLESGIQIMPEQHLGSRLHPGSEPGPFLIERRVSGHAANQAVLELVHPAEIVLPAQAQGKFRTGIDAKRSRVASGIGWPPEASIDVWAGSRRVPVSMAWRALIDARDRMSYWSTGNELSFSVPSIISRHALDLLRAANADPQQDRVILAIKIHGAQGH